MQKLPVNLVKSYELNGEKLLCFLSYENFFFFCHLYTHAHKCKGTCTHFSQLRCRRRRRRARWRFQRR